MSFIVQISPFVHLFTLKIMFLNPPHQGSALDLLGALNHRRKLCLHFILYLATPLTPFVSSNPSYNIMLELVSNTPRHDMRLDELTENCFGEL
jgi:hypothetical protein